VSKADARPTGRRGPSTPTQPTATEPPAAGQAAGDAELVDAGPAAGTKGEPGEPGAIVRAGGVVVSVVFAFVSAIFELLLSTLRAGDFVSVWKGNPIGSGHGPLIPLAVVLAVAGNIGLAWFAVGTTGRRWALGPPWALWTVVMLIAAGVRTHEGDYLLSGTNYVALAMILIGSLTFAIYAYRMILKRIPPAVGSTSAKRPN
jgi:hypothetical protein